MSAKKRDRSPEGPGKKIVLVGLGLIGSHLLRHLARIPGIGRVALVDDDRYKIENVVCQAIDAGDVGRWKARSAAARLRRLAPDLLVEAHVSTAERLPLGVFRADAVISAVDNLATRLRLAEACWRVGAPLIDGAVDAGGLLTRVDVYLPGEEAPCMHCGLDDEQYAALPQRYPCQPGAAPRDEPAPTDAPSELGATCAGLLGLELRKLLAGRLDQLAVAREVMLDLAWHGLIVTELRRARGCRFDHAAPGVEVLEREAGALTVADAFALGGADPATGDDVALALESRRWITRVECACGSERRVLRTDASLERRPVRCRRCGKEMHPDPIGFADRLVRGDLPERALGATLARTGAVRGDVLRIEPAHGAARWFELP